MSANEQLLDNHREFCGPDWTIHTAVLDWLIQCGLRRHHSLVEIGCGPLRIGLHLITFLDSGNYTGIEPEVRMLDAGREKEISCHMLLLQKPTFIRKPVEECSAQGDWALAWDVFNHLSDRLLETALNGVRCNNWLLNVLLGDVHINFSTNGTGWSYRYSPTRAQLYTPASFQNLVNEAGYQADLLREAPIADWPGVSFGIYHLTRETPW